MFYSFLFVNFSVMSVLMLISASSWWMMWICLEMGSFFFIPLLMEGKSLHSKSNSFYYFIIQCVSSFIFIFSFLSGMGELMKQTLIVFSMMLKLGAFPFHQWMFDVSETLSWMKFLFLSTVMKIGPLVVILSWMSSYWVGLKIIIFSLFSALSGFNSNSLRVIIIHSSLVHLSWVILASSLSCYLAVMYFIFYSVTLCLMVLFLDYYDIDSLKDLMSEIFFNPLKMIFFLVLCLSFMGIPPMVGFFMKLNVIKALLIQNMVIESILILLLSVFPIFLYMKVMFFSMSLWKVENLNFKISSFKSGNFLFLLLLLYLGLIMWFW